MGDELQRLQRLLADALVAGDVESLRAGAASLPAPLRAAVAHVDGDGFRIAALLVAKLRFERLVQGSARAAEWFDADPRGFVAAFRRYHVEVAPTAHDPRGEAVLFAAWTDATT